MSRPRKEKIVRGCPVSHMFKPAGVPAHRLEVAVLSHEEMEAIRLADLEGLTQERGAEEMGISRATFGRLLQSAHGIIADAIVNGKSLSIDGGVYVSPDEQIPGGFTPGRCGGRHHGRRGFHRGGM